MKISVVTVTYNSEATIIDTLKSVEFQSYPSIEHIIIDGASKDSTLNIIQKEGKRVSVTISEKDSGIYDAMNKGIKYATGDVIGFLNSDDMYSDATVVEQIASVFDNKSIDACFADLVYVDPIDTKKVVRYWKGAPYKMGTSLNGWMPAHPTFYVRREVFEKFGVFDTEFKRQADFELTLRFFERYKIKTLYVPKVWIRMRSGGVSNNSILGIIKGNIEAYRACRKNGFLVSPFFMIRKISSRIPQFFFKAQKV